MTDLLQWGGFLALIVGYWFLRKPAVSAFCTFAGCLSILVWALLINPVPWGIVCLEIMVGAIAIRNLADAIIWEPVQ